MNFILCFNKYNTQYNITDKFFLRNEKILTFFNLKYT